MLLNFFVTQFIYSETVAFTSKMPLYFVLNIEIKPKNAILVNMKPNVIKREFPSITNAPYWRRIQAYLIDFIVILIIGFVSFGVIDRIYSNSSVGSENNNKLIALRIESGLYIDGGNNNTIVLGKDVNEGNYELIYLMRLEHFYTQPNTHFDYSLSSYYVEGVEFDYYRDVLKKDKDNSPFTFDESFPSLPYRFKDTLTRDEKVEAWASLYNTAVNNFKTDPEFKEVDGATRRFVSLNLTISAFIGTIIPWLLCPLFFGHGRSLGKFFTKLAVVNKDGYQIKAWQTVVRFLFFGIVETALNIYGFFIPLFLTSSILTVTKNNRALHDLVSGTFVVDAKVSKIFKNAADEEAYYKSSVDEQRANDNYFTEAIKPVYAPKEQPESNN